MKRKSLSVIGGSLLLVACSTAHPVLYPNAHLQSVGKEIAEKILKLAGNWQSRLVLRKAVGMPVVWRLGL